MSDATTKQPERLSHLYVVAGADGAGPYKVGITYNLHRRLRELQTGEARRIGFAHSHRLPRSHAEAAERRAHQLLAADHAHGEWFTAALPDVIAAVDQAVADTATAVPQTPEPVKRARIVYDPDAVAAILADVSAGNSLRRACTTHGMDHSTLLRWVREDQPPGLANQYAHAREQQAHALADGIVDMAMDPSATADPNLLRVRLDAAKWAASKILPRVYGDRIEANINHTGNVQVGWVIDLTPAPPAIEGEAETVRIEDCTPPKEPDE